MRRLSWNAAARSVPIALAILLAVPPLPRAQQPPTGGAQQPVAGSQPADAPAFKPEELEQIVAPIALYPDPLVAQVMMASTYPLEVIQAARFVKANPNLKDAALNEELKKYDWDDAVKSLVSFPQVLELMNEKIDWMQKLGDAFLAQRKETMDAIQRLRAKAQAQGSLKSNEQQKVIVEPAVSTPPAAPPAQAGQPAPPAQPAETQTVIKIEPANPQVVYVPAYNPTVVYGAWPYPAYPPYYPYPPAYAWGAAAVSFGAGMAVGAAVWGGCNWSGGDVDIDVNKSNNFTNTVNRGDRATQIKNERGSGQGGKQSFNHNPEHRKGAQYRDAGTQQRYNRGSSPQAGTRDAYRGRADQGGRQDTGRGAADQGGRQDTGRGGAGQGGGGTARTGAGGAGSAGGGDRGGAFEGMGQGRSQSAHSQRGQSSVSSSRASGYSGGGGSSRAGGGGGGGGGGSRGGGGGGGGRGGGRR